MLAGFEIAQVLGKKLFEAQGLNAEAGKSPVSGVPVAILLGLALNNNPLVRLPAALTPGIKFCTTAILRTGIICVGAKLSLYDVVDLGSACVPVVIGSIGTGLATTMWLGSRMGLSMRMASLIAAGCSICGVTAITAVAPAIAATEAEIAVAVATVVAFGTMSMLTYPYLAHNFLPLPQSEQVGMFLGIAVHDTSQVMGSALSYQEMYDDEEVLKWAAVTKLTRNIFLAAVIPGLAYINAAAAASSAAAPNALSLGGLLQGFVKHTPLFVLGFIGMSVLRSVGDATLASSSSSATSTSSSASTPSATDDGLALGVFSAPTWASLTSTIPAVGSKYMLGTAMAAVGLGTSASVFKGVGMRPVFVGMGGAGAVGCAGLGGAVLLGELGAFDRKQPNTLE